MMERIKLEACSFLLRNGVTSLPIDLRGLNFMLSLGVTLGNYSEWGSLIENYKKTEYAATHDAFTLWTDNMIYILLKDGLSSAEQNERIAHELGHVVLRHSRQDGILGYSSNENVRDRQEEEANRFADAILAPTPVFARLCITSPQDIERMTGLSAQRSKAISVDVREEPNTPANSAKTALADLFMRATSARAADPGRSCRRPLRIIAILGAGALIAILCIAGWYAHRTSATVCASKAGNAYHKADCIYIQGRSAFEMTRQEATNAGYVPCKVCKP